MVQTVRWFLYCLIMLCSYLGIMNFSAHAQGETGKNYIDKTYNLSVRVTDVDTLLSGKQKILLWGIEKINMNTPVFALIARNNLENLIMNEKVECTIKVQTSEYLKAQCINAQEQDLSLSMIQQGFVSVNRTEVYGTIYEKPYLEAEKFAQMSQKGIWYSENSQSGAHSASQNSASYLMGSVLFSAILVTSIGVISYYVLTGFKKIMDIQNHSFNLASRERSLKEKEKHIIATMIHSELRENKPKINAYLTVYDEMLNEFSNASTLPDFMKTGEIVQKQPALSRNIFDGNTNKLDMLGAELASDLIHYYARIKTIPDYVEITPSMSREEAYKIIKSAVEHAKKLDIISNQLMDVFENNAHLKPPPS